MVWDENILKNTTMYYGRGRGAYSGFQNWFYNNGTLNFGLLFNCTCFMSRKMMKQALTDAKPMQMLLNITFHRPQ